MTPTEINQLINKCNRLQENDHNGSYIEGIEDTLNIDIDVLKTVLKSEDKENQQEVINTLINKCDKDFLNDILKEIHSCYNQLINE